MHAKPDLRVFLKWMIAGPGSVITDVICLMSKQQKLDLAAKHWWSRLWSGIAFSLMSVLALASGFVNYSHVGDTSHIYGGFAMGILACCSGLYYHFWYYGKFRDPEMVERQIEADGQKQLVRGRKLMRTYAVGLLLAPIMILIVAFVGIENAQVAFAFYLLLVTVTTFLPIRQRGVNLQTTDNNAMNRSRE